MKITKKLTAITLGSALLGTLLITSISLSAVSINDIKNIKQDTPQNQPPTNEPQQNFTIQQASQMIVNWLTPNKILYTDGSNTRNYEGNNRIQHSVLVGFDYSISNVGTNEPSNLQGNELRFNNGAWFFVYNLDEGLELYLLIDKNGIVSLYT